MNKNIENRTIIVLGMHRSGTSALTGSLEAGGLYLGEINQYSEDNKKGNRESESIMTLHEDMLERNGGSWDRPVQNLKWHPIHLALRNIIIQSYSEKPIWGFKDPRTLFSLKGWLHVLPKAELIGIYRHPYFVAESLYRRNSMSYDDGLQLWLSYNRVLLWYYKNSHSFPIIEFSERSSEFQTQLSMLAKKINLGGDTQSFFDSTLRQSQMPDLSDEPNSTAALKIYGELNAVNISNA